MLTAVANTFGVCYCAPAPNRWGIKWWCCLTSVCLTSVAYIGPKSRTERPRKSKIGTEVAHVTRDSDTTFKVKGQGYQADLLTAVLAHQAAAAVGVGMCWPWETAATFHLLSGARCFGAHGRRGGSISRRPPAFSLFQYRHFRDAETELVKN